MKYAAAIVAVAVGANAMAYMPPANTTEAIHYETEVVTAYTTYCPGPTTITHGDKTYTVTEETTLTITDCPCTISKPVITTSEVVCHDCPKPTEPAHETGHYQPPPPPPAHNGTVPAPTGPHETGVVPTPAPTAGAAKVAGLSGLVAFLGLAAAL